METETTETTETATPSLGKELARTLLVSTASSTGMFAGLFIAGNLLHYMKRLRKSDDLPTQETTTEA